MKMSENKLNTIQDQKKELKNSTSDYAINDLSIHVKLINLNFFYKNGKYHYDEEDTLFIFTHEYVSNGRLKIDFGNVNANLTFTNLGLTTLQGMPDKCNSLLVCQNNIKVIDKKIIAKKLILKNNNTERINVKLPNLSVLNLHKNKLSTFENFPDKCNNLNISNNQFTSLIDCPKVKVDLNIEDNNVVSLEGLKTVDGLNAKNNILLNLKHCPKINNYAYFCNNKLTSLEGLNGNFKNLFANNNQIKDCKGIYGNRHTIELQDNLIEKFVFRGKFTKIDLTCNPIRTIKVDNEIKVINGVVFDTIDNLNYYDYYKSNKSVSFTGSSDTIIKINRFRYLKFEDEMDFYTTVFKNYPDIKVNGITDNEEVRVLLNSHMGVQKFDL